MSNGENMKKRHPKIAYIFDYGDRWHDCELKPINIIAISVTILSGDETIDVYYEDGTVEYFDSCDNRIENHFDGNYVVMGDEITKWFNFKKYLGHNDIAYKRQGDFAK